MSVKELQCQKQSKTHQIDAIYYVINAIVNIFSIMKLLFPLLMMSGVGFFFRCLVNVYLCDPLLIIEM